MIFRSLIIVCFLHLMTACAIQAGDAPASRIWTPFIIPMDIAPASPIAFHGEPIHVNSPRVVAQDGHFMVDGKRLRIWGMNMSYGANFPTHQDAQRLAARLEAFGINSVRFHHMDANYFKSPKSIWDVDDPTKMSAESLDRLDYFIDQLAQRGIYANLNLHVSRTHSQILGLPVSKGTGNYDKIVDLFTPEIIEDQRAYARKLLTHVNAYRKVSYAKDPAIAFIEISNEDSFFTWHSETKLRKMDRFYKKILRSQFNDWLTKKYHTTNALQAAWTPLSKNSMRVKSQSFLQSTNKDSWIFGAKKGAKATLTHSKGDQVRIDIKSVGPAIWNIEYNHLGLNLKEEMQYALVFSAKADKARQIEVAVREADSPWASRGLRQAVKLSTHWHEFKLSVYPRQSDDNARLTFLLGQVAVPLNIKNVKLLPRKPVGLNPTESLEKKQVNFIGEGESEARLADRMRFMAQTEKAYYDSFYQFIHKDLGSDALVTGTMVYGVLSLWAQSDMDYIDAHAYWSHPKFGTHWSKTDWTITHSTFVETPEQNKLYHDAALRLAGKPFTVSEYNHPAPNDHQAECVPVAAMFAAAQDWDGLWFFGYDDDTRWDYGAFDRFFDMQANPSKWGFMPVGAKMYRDAQIEPLKIGTVLPLTTHPTDPLPELITLQLNHGHSSINGLTARWNIDRDDVLKQRIAVRFTGRHPKPMAAYPNSVTQINLQNGQLDVTGHGAMIRINSAAATTNMAKDGRAIVLGAASCDDQPLASSKRVLITIGGRCKNTQMGFSKDRLTVRNKWGKPPVLIETMDASLIWPYVGTMQLTPLKPDTSRATSFKTKLAPGRHPLLHFLPDHRTMWYLLEPVDQ